MNWLVDGRVSRRMWLVIGLYAVVMLAASTAGLVFGAETSVLMTDRQLIGTLVLYALLPCYLVAGGLLANARTVAFAPSFNPNPRVNDVLRVAQRPTAAAVGGGVAGALLGLAENGHLIVGFIVGQLPLAFDVVFVGGMLVWTLIGFVIAWRVHVCVELWRLGRRVDVDVLNLEACRGFGAAATANVGFVAGAVASMAPQSLDAEFRWESYEACLF